MGSSPELLRVEELTKIFKNGAESKTVLDSVSFSLGKQDSLAVVGPSGCGKTTLLLIIAGLIPPTYGSASLDGEAVTGPTRKVALVLQHYGLFPWKTVGANIVLGAQLQNIPVPREELADLKRELGIEALDHLYPEQVSGGQRQRVALARALLLRPSLLLLDEPFAAIDALTRERLQDHLITIFRQRRFSFIIVTHNIEEAIFLGRKIIVLNDVKPGVRTLLENPDAGTPGYRNKPEFFQRSLQLRNTLEGIE
jgi:NitT/TauT family transport system ATP-binding protein